MRTSPSLSLFDDPGKDLSLIEALAPNKPTDKAQQRFRQLVAKIERQREQLKQWQAYLARYHQRVAGELQPLQEQLRAGRQHMVALLDEWLTQPVQRRRLNRRHRTKLRELLMNLLEGLLAEREDEALEALREKYQERPDEETQRLELELTHSMLNDVLGLDIGDDHGASSAEELMDYAERQMHERAAEAARRAEERRQARSTQRPTSAKAQAAQAQRELAAKEISQSLRDVFRKLVSALHPDREPDAEERQRKNELMQRVNRAYEASDLLTLLALQLEIEQIDAAHLASLTPQRLTHYNQILREQLAELEAELNRFQQPFRMLIDRGWGTRLTIDDVDRQLSADIEQVRQTIRQLQEDLVAFRDPERLRESLNDYEPQAPFNPLDDFEELTALMDGFQPPPRYRRRRRKR